MRIIGQRNLPPELKAKFLETLQNETEEKYSRKVIVVDEVVPLGLIGRRSSKIGTHQKLKAQRFYQGINRSSRRVTEKRFKRLSLGARLGVGLVARKQTICRVRVRQNTQSQERNHA